MYKFTSQYCADTKLGFKNEDVVKPKIEKFFNKKFNTTGRYDPFDYFDDEKKIWIELKTRRVRKRQYDDTMIDISKVEYGLNKVNEGCRAFLMWSFTDKLCYYELKKDVKVWYERYGGRTDRGVDERKVCCYFPVDKLKTITKKKSYVYK